MTQVLSFDERDEFHRRQVGEKLMNLLTSAIDISPMVIDGGWGTGKTEFCQKLISLIKEQKPDYQTVYLDAFRSDHSGEPLLALLAQIIKDCTPEDSDGRPSSERNDVIEKFTKGGLFVAKTVAKAAVAHLVKQNADTLTEGFQNAMNKADAEQMAESVSEVGKTLADKAIDATIEILLKEQIEAEKDLEALKQSLENFAQEKPILLFIDELDRCRPDYAVAMLETIKHVFDVRNVKVVLVTNSCQLHAAINHRYGAAVDAQKYLDKFLKFNFKLPEKTLNKRGLDRELSSITHFNNLINSSAMLGDTGIKLSDSPRSFVHTLIKQNELSLREVETFIRYLEIYHNLSRGGDLSDENILGYQLLRITGVFIYCFKSDIRNSIQKDKTDGNEIAGIFGVTALPRLDDYSEGLHRFFVTQGFATMLAQHAVYCSGDFQEKAGDKIMDHYIRLFFYDKGSFNHMPKDIFEPIKEVFSCLQLEV